MTTLAEAVRGRLDAAGIEYSPAGDKGRHWILLRGACAVMVECSLTGTRAGAAGRVTEGGLAMLMWREGEAYWQGRGVLRRAIDDEVEALRSFQADVEQALTLP